MEPDIKIYGIHERDFLINSLKNFLDLKNEDIIYDDRIEGGLPLYTMEKALKQPFNKNITHRCVLPDDMICCNEFKHVIRKIVNTHPNAIIGLFPYNFFRNEDKYYKLSSPYIKNNELICGNGIIFPQFTIDPVFNLLHNMYKEKIYLLKSEALLMTAFRILHYQVINTIPSPVQHIGDDYGSFLPYKVDKNRKTGFFKEDCLTNIDWDNKEILDFPGYDYSFKGRIRDYILSGKGIFFDENFYPRK